MPRRCRNVVANCCVGGSPKAVWRHPNRPSKHASVRENATVCRPVSAGCGFCRPWTQATSTLNICVSYRLTGALDEARLRAAFNDVVARHAILRTTYGVDSEGEPYQVFSDDVEISWRSHDLTELAEGEGERQVEALARDEFGRPFDLDGRVAAEDDPDTDRHRRIRAAARRASHLLGRRLLGCVRP